MGYLNPYVEVSREAGQWTCALCGWINVLDRSFTDADLKQMAASACEIPASQEYIDKPPPVPVYILAFDTTPQAAASGFLDASCEIVKKLAEENAFPPCESKVCLLTYDSHVHFYSLKESLKQPRMMTQCEGLDTLPVPVECLVCEIGEVRRNLCSVLESIPRCAKASALSKTTPACLPDVLRKMKLLLADMAGGKAAIFHAGPIKAESAQETSAVQGMNKLLGITDVAFRKLGSELIATKRITCDLFMAANAYRVTIRRVTVDV